MKKYNYENKNVYVGLDVHKKTYAYAIRCERVTVKRGVLPADPQALVVFLHKCFPQAQIHTAYEAGMCGFVLHRVLLENGIKNIVVNPSSIETAARDRVKTDKRDSLKIALHLESGRLRSIHIPSLEQEQNREITRFREDLAKKKRTISNQIKSLLLRQGIKARESSVSKKWLQELKDLDLSTKIRFVLNGYIEAWLNIDMQMQQVEKQLKAQALEEKEMHAILESFPGIGLITARVLANELSNMEQFSNVKKLYSFTGLTPREYSSGEHTRLGHISRQGKALLRKTLVQSAWIAIRTDFSLKCIFEHLSKRVGAKKAIIAIARRLIGRVRACLRDKKLYKNYRVNTRGELITT